MQSSIPAQCGRAFLFHSPCQWRDEVSVSTRVWPWVHLKRSEQAQSQVWGGKSRSFTRSIKLTVELPQHANNKLLQCLEPQDVDKSKLRNPHMWFLVIFLNKEYWSPEVCSAPQSSWKHRQKAPGNCSLTQNCWMTEIVNPWCFERCWTWSGQTPGRLLAVDCSGGPSLYVHSSYRKRWSITPNS